MANTQTTPYATAFKYLTLGYSVIPSGGGESHKAALVKWTPYQEQKPTDEQLEQWQNFLNPIMWACITGTISGIFVIDCDTPEAAEPLEQAGLCPHVRTPRGGYHFYFRHPGYPVKTQAGILPKVDIRGEGGYVNFTGSNGTGNGYSTLIMPVSDTLYNIENLPQAFLAAIQKTTKVHPTTDTSESEPIPEGQRNGYLASLAGTLRRRGANQGTIEAALLAENESRCNPPLPDVEVKGIAASVSRYPPNGNNNVLYKSIVRDNSKIGTNVTENVTENVTPVTELSLRIEEWIKTSKGWCDTSELDRDLSIVSKTDKDNRRQILWRFENERHLIEKHPKSNRQFRYINKQLTEIDYKHVSTAAPLPIIWPLGIHQKVNSFPGNLAVVAGTTNAGKTALLMDVMRLNNDFPLPIYYWYSEGGEAELRSRLDNCPGMAIEEWNFRAFSRTCDFADVIAPDCLNIVDYLELTDELFRVNTHLTAISDRIGQGLAIVAIQKKQGAKYGRGQEFSAEKSRLYISLDEAEGRGCAQATIRKGKSWAIKGQNPNGMVCTFQIIDGWISEVLSDWRYPVD